MKRHLLLAAVLALVCASPSIAGQVPNPVNAAASVGSGDVLASSGTNPQQAADSGLSTTAAGQNKVLAGPASGGAGALSERSLVSADMPGSGAGSGSVTSVGISLPGQFSCTGSPVTASGTLGCSWVSQSANTFLAAPSSSAGTPSFRALTAADMPSSGAGSGSVTSVGLSVPSIFTAGGSPVTGAGTLSVGLNTQSANLVWAGPPSGSAAAPAFRSLVAADIPNLSASYDATGAAATAQTNAETYASNASNISGGSLASAYGGSRLIKLGTLAAANFNSTADQAIALTGPSRYAIAAIVVTNCTVSLTSAQGIFYTAASKGGIALFGNATTSWALMTSATVARLVTASTGTAQGALFSGSATIYLSLTTAQGAAAACDIYVLGYDLT